MNTMSEGTKTDNLIARVHIITGEDGDSPHVTVDGFAVTSGTTAAQRIEQYASRHGMSLWQLAQCVYWPGTSDEYATRRNVVRIVQRALGF